MADYIKTEWHEGDIIGKNELNKIEVQLDTLSDLMIDENRIGSTLTMVGSSSNVPTKLEVKSMSSENGGITPNPPSEEQNKNILFSDGQYGKLSITGNNTTDTNSFTVNRTINNSNNELYSFNLAAANTSTAGLMSNSDKTNLDTLASGTMPNNNSTIVTSSNINNITGLVTTSNFTDQLQNIGVVSTSANGLAPQLDGKSDSLLRGNGTWSKLQTSDIENGIVKDEKLEDMANLTPNNYGQSGAVSVGLGGSFSVPYFYVNKKGRITAASTQTVSLSSTINASSISGTISWNNLPRSYYSDPIRADITVLDNSSIEHNTRTYGYSQTYGNFHFTYITIYYKVTSSGVDGSVAYCYEFLPFREDRGDGMKIYGDTSRHISQYVSGTQYSRGYIGPLYYDPSSGYWEFNSGYGYKGTTKDKSVMVPYIIRGVSVP